MRTQPIFTAVLCQYCYVPEVLVPCYWPLAILLAVPRCCCAFDNTLGILGAHTVLTDKYIQFVPGLQIDFHSFKTVEVTTRLDEFGGCCSPDVNRILLHTGRTKKVSRHSSKKIIYTLWGHDNQEEFAQLIRDAKERHEKGIKGLN